MDAATIGVEALQFSYRRRQPPIVDGLTHQFAPGAMTVVGGESGRGKSTLLFILGLLLTPTSGRVFMDGRDVTRASDQHRARLRAQQVGFMFQDAQLDPSRTTLDNVMEPSLYAGESGAVTASRARSLLDQFGLGHRADHRPGEISGGQAQRVALCRALVNQPRIILADEPTGNLDRHNAELVLSALRRSAEGGCTVIIATHDDFVRGLCDEELAL